MNTYEVIASACDAMRLGLSLIWGEQATLRDYVASRLRKAGRHILGAFRNQRKEPRRIILPKPP